MAEYSAEHKVTVTAYFERERDDFLFKAPTTYAVIEVQPPIDPGDDFTFKRIILGQEWALVDLRRLFANAKAAVFMAESSMPEQAKRHDDIAVIAKRIGHLANHPNAALGMMEDRPFPEQEKPEPKLELIREVINEPEPEEREDEVSAPAEEEQAERFTVHLPPVDVPSLTVSLPPLPDIVEKSLRPDELPSVEVPGFKVPDESEGGTQPSVFGPSTKGLTRFAPEASPLPWPPHTSDGKPWPTRASGGKHVRKDQTEN